MDPATTTDRLVSFVVDPTMYTGATRLPVDVYGDLDRVVRTDLFYHYSTPICAQRWLDVCADPAYGHLALMERAEALLPRAAEALKDALHPGARVALISLGSGDGEFDTRILEALMGSIPVESYCALDFSFELLRQAMHRVARGMGGSRGFPVRARCGDFTDADACASAGRAAGTARLFALTGFTLGNYAEQDLLADIRRMMDGDDHLLVDARLHDLGADASRAARPGSRLVPMVESYDLASVRRFVFGPVEVATHATAEDVNIELEVSGRTTAVPNALNILIHCRDLDTTMRLTGRPVRRERLDLAVTTCYRLEDLVSWIGRQGFDLVWSEADTGVAFLLLRRS